MKTTTVGAERPTGLGLCLAALALAWGGPACAQVTLAADAAARELGGLSIDELAQINVTSVSKRPEGLNHAASSVYVVTEEAIRQSGAQTIPEALRLAPNLEVMRIDALDYSITARGFAGFESANKLLVLVDGRSVYTPLFSGVDWDEHHVLMDDIDRIEVISGPGGTLWGANAVNGVINVTTRSAFDTEGGLAVVNLGTLDSDVRLRYGAQLGDSGAGRVYATAFRRADLEEADGSSANDGWDGWQAGFRADWARGVDAITLQGDLQDANIEHTLDFGQGYSRGGNVLGRWTHAMGGASIEVQAYYDEIERQVRGVHDRLRTWDVQAQHAFPLGARHAVVWGGGYRITKDEFRTLSDPQLLDPPRRRNDIANLFIQDEIALRPDLLLTLGLKLEANDYTTSEWMPNARLGWRISERQFVWGAVSRAIRNPSRIERDFSIPGLVDPGHMGSEKLIAYELGYRGRITDAASVTVTTYFHDYDDIRTNELDLSWPRPVLVGNTMEGETWGVEAWGEVQVADWWRLSLGGSILEKEFRLKPGSRDISRFEAMGADPGYWGKIRSRMDLTDRLSLDMALRVYDDLPRLAASGYVGASGYAEASLRLAWRVTDQIELAVSGQDLLHARHAEASETRRSEIPRSAFVTLRWTP